MNNIPSLIKRYYPILLLLILLIIANIFSKNTLTTTEFITALASAGITAVGWIFSFQLNKTTFQRSEIIKNRDQVVSLVESFFNDLIPFFDKRETTEKDIEDLKDGILWALSHSEDEAIKKNMIDSVSNKFSYKIVTEQHMRKWNMIK